MNQFLLSSQFEENKEIGYFDSTIRCVFEKGNDQKTEFLEHRLKNQKVKYTLTFNHKKANDSSPLTLTVFAETKSKDLSEELIQFQETKYLPLGMKSSLEITVGHRYMYINGWTTVPLRGDYPEIPETIPRNLAYNTIVNTTNLVADSILNLEPKPITQKFELKLTSGHFIQSRFISVSSQIPKQISIENYIYNLSNCLLGLELNADPMIKPDSYLHFNIEPNSSLEFKFSSFKDRGFTHIV